MSRRGTTVPRAAAWLGGAGLIPYAGLAGLLWFGPQGWQDHAARGLASYGAIILGFMGGCRWGFAASGLGEGPGWRSLTLSVLPALYGWVALLVGGAAVFGLLALGFAGLLIADLALARMGGAPAWWPRLRLPLTAGAVLALLAGALA